MRGLRLRPLMLGRSSSIISILLDKRAARQRDGVTLSLDSLRAEARKCVLLCSNCHAEVEAGSLACRYSCRRASDTKLTIHRNPG